MEIKKQYRPEIEGLRVIAAILVAIYHIWMMKVSGGVDVFFVVSGFLITTSLLSKYARDGYVKFSTFVLGLLKRLLPSAITVLIFTVVMSYFILPEVRHVDTIREVIASLFYYENWQLAVTNTDYLAQTNEKSPVQHFWAMSIQGQFYLIWFLIIAVTIFLTKKFKLNFKKVFSIILISIFLCSLIYSIYLTNVNQPWAYFDTRTRVWEFAIGGILMLVIFKVNLSNYISVIAGWLGLIILISTGLLINVESSFPGYLALVPVVAAVLILIAGQNPTKFGVEKVLGSKPMVYLGGLSYGFYLWHWPLLSFYYVIFDTMKVSIIHGLIIILISLLLSIITTKYIEKPIGNFISSKKFSIKSFAPIYALAGTLLVLLFSWYGYNEYKADIGKDLVGNQNYPGALVNILDEEIEVDNPIPELSSIKADQAAPYHDGCHVAPGVSEVNICEYGEIENYNYTIALVGGSKATHWLPSLESFSEEESIRILNVTKSGCRLSFNPEIESGDDCHVWNKNVVDEVSKENPDLIIALADIAQSSEPEVPEGFLEQFSRFENKGIEILAIRDTPYFSEDVPECLSANGFESDKCDASRDNTVIHNSPWDRLENPPSNVHYVDYTTYICDEDRCPALVGNIVAYIDKSHMSATFNETFGPIVSKDIMDILEDNR